MPSLPSTCPTRIENSPSYFLISENLFLCLSFILQSVNKVTIAAHAKTVGKIVFIEKWKYFLYYIFACLFIFSKQIHCNWFWQWRRAESSSISSTRHYRVYIIFWYGGRLRDFLSLYRKDKGKCSGFYGWMNQCKRLIQFHIISTEYLCTR